MKREMSTIRTILPWARRRRWWLAAAGAAGLLLLAWWLLLRWMDAQVVPPEAVARFTPCVLFCGAEGEPLDLHRGSDDRWWLPIPLSEVPPQLVEDVIAVEDLRFYEHDGIDYHSMMRAVWQLLTHWRIVSGGSTITMQLVNQYCGHGRTIGYKLRQMGRARNWERTHTKHEILEAYFNMLPYGGKLYGIEAASRYYFGRPARELNRAEQLLLVGLPQSPNRFRPDLHHARALWRRDVVLHILQRAGRMTPEEAGAIRQFPLRYRDFRIPCWPHSPDRDFFSLVAQFHPGRTEYHTTLRPELQRVVREELMRGRNGAPGVADGAAVVIETATGRVRALVGSLPDGDPQTAAINAAICWRSPGSALKPFLYGEALNGGLLVAATLLDDAPLALPDYRPGNFDGRFRGKVTAADALADSLNTPAVRVLRDLGVKRMLRLLAPLGVLPPSAEKDLEATERRVGLALAVGGLESQLLALTAAYAALGRRRGCTFLEREPPPEMGRYWEPGAVDMLLQMMRTHPLPGAEGLEVAWKTGTSNGNRDAWCFAVTPEWTVGVWYGNRRGSPAKALVGGELAAPSAGRIQSFLHHGAPAKWDAAPATIETTMLCQATGLGATFACDQTQPGAAIADIPLRRCQACRLREAAAPRRTSRLLAPAPGTYQSRRGAPVRFILRLQPSPAHLYLNGEYLGERATGSPLELPVGAWTIAVWGGPGYEATRTAVTVTPPGR